MSSRSQSRTSEVDTKFEEFMNEVVLIFMSFITFRLLTVILKWYHNNLLPGQIFY